jgi:hypothetical protein
LHDALRAYPGSDTPDGAGLEPDTFAAPVST